MNVYTALRCLVLSLAGSLVLSGCRTGPGPAFDRPFPHGQVTDAHWETQQTNAEASDFVFYDHEFVGDTSKLTPLGQKHLLQVACRLDHVPFPIVIEETPNQKNLKLDAERRLAIIQKLAQLGVCKVDQRVVVAAAIADGVTAIEGEAEYYQIVGGSDYGGYGRGSSGYGGIRR
ncbi:MAG: hypothetical protein ABSG68_14255 [Thermoguttaceae bacterium]|jgi:hypothetical protein